MRPNKKVLIYGFDEAELSRVGYVLWTRHYAATLAADGVAALQQLAEAEFDCAIVLAAHGPAAAEAVVRGLRGARPNMPVLLVATPGSGAATEAHVACAGMAEMLERLRVLCVRKRGPKNAAVPRYYIKDVTSISSDLQRVG